MSDWLPWLPLAGCLLCVWACRSAVKRILGLERLHAMGIAKVWRKGKASEPAEVEAARKVP